MSPVLSALPGGSLGRVGMVARFKPVHRVHAAILRALCARAEAVVLGIGSSNRHDAQNPFSAAETARMIRLALPADAPLTLIEVPDLGDGPRWAEMVRGMMDPLDLFVSANVWVRDLVAPFWPVVHPVHLLEPHQRSPLSGSDVRRVMARGEPWQELLPEAVARYCQQHGLVERLRREFGEELRAE